MKKKLLAAGAMSVVGFLGSCASPTGTFVNEHTGYAVIRGRITQVNNLSTGDVQRFHDGMALTVNKRGCKVQIAFANDEAKVMEIGPGTILVYGPTEDFVLQTAPGMPAR